MNVATREIDATDRVEVGIRELKNDLSRYLGRVRAGGEVIVTDRGRPVARLTPLDAPTDRLAELISAGIVRPPTTTGARRALPTRRRTGQTVSDLVSDQRR